MKNMNWNSPDDEWDHAIMVQHGHLWGMIEDDLLDQMADDCIEDNEFRSLVHTMPPER